MKPISGASVVSKRRWLVYASAAAAAIGAIGASAITTGGAGASSARQAAVMPANPKPAVNTSSNTGASQEAILSYWTPARMAAAKPLDLTAAASASGSAKATNAGNTATGAPGLAGGSAPAGAQTTTSGGSVINANPQSSSVLPADGGYPGPNDTYNWIGAQNTFPVSTVGKLFFSEPSGNFVCSATATFGNATEKDMVWTAGHCVGAQGGRTYYSNWEFCPEYNNGASATVGCWTWALAQQTGGWYFNGYWSADYAYLYMQPTGTVKTNHLVSVTGGLGFAWNWGRDQFWQDFGYPSASPYSGGKLVVTSAEHRYDVTNPGDPGLQDNSIGSAQTPGFSGGPWVLSFGKNQAGDPLGHGDWINGDNSYYFTSGGPGGGNEYGTEIQSPYYDTNACNFWKGGSKWTGTC